MNGNMPSAGSMLQFVQNTQSKTVGQVHIQDNRARLILRNGNQPLFSRMRDHALKAQLMRQIAQNLRKGDIIFYYEDKPPVRRQVSAVIIDELLVSGLDAWRQRHRTGRLVRGDARSTFHVGCGAPFIFNRERQRKYTSLPGSALHRKIAAQQFCEIAGYRPTQASATVFEMRAAVRLPECLEYDRVLLLWNTDASILYGKGNRVVGRRENPN